MSAVFHISRKDTGWKNMQNTNTDIFFVQIRIRIQIMSNMLDIDIHPIHISYIYLSIRIRVWFIVNRPVTDTLRLGERTENICNFFIRSSVPCSCGQIGMIKTSKEATNVTPMNEFWWCPEPHQSPHYQIRNDAPTPRDLISHDFFQPNWKS